MLCVVLVLCVYMWCCVLCVHVVCGVGVVCVHVVLCVVCTCGVWRWWCVWCGVWWNLARGKPSVCTFETPPCVRSGRLRVYRQQARMSWTCGPVAGTHGDVLTVHGGVLNVHTGVFSSLSSPLSFYLSVALSRSFFPLLFSCLVSLLTCLFLFFSSLFSFLLYILFNLLFLHTQRRDQTDKWLYQLRTAMHHAIHWIKRELSICQSLPCHNLGSVRVLSQIKPQAPLLVVPIRPCLIFMLNVLSALPV